jgi:hypothetical protein
MAAFTKHYFHQAGSIVNAKIPNSGRGAQLIGNFNVGGSVTVRKCFPDVNVFQQKAHRGPALGGMGTMKKELWANKAKKATKRAHKNN